MSCSHTDMIVVPGKFIARHQCRILSSSPTTGLRLRHSLPIGSSSEIVTALIISYGQPRPPLLQRAGGGRLQRITSTELKRLPAQPPPQGFCSPLRACGRGCVWHRFRHFPFYDVTGSRSRATVAIKFLINERRRAWARFETNFRSSLFYAARDCRWPLVGEL